MRVLLINPPRVKPNMPTLRDEICFQDVIYTPFPIRLAQVAGVLLRKFPDVELNVIDANALGLSISDLEKDFPSADIMIFQSAAGIIREDAKVASIAKRKSKDVKVVIIESVVSPLYPERFLKDFSDIDIVIQGQPESVIPDIISGLSDLSSVLGITYRNGDKIISNGDAKILTDMDSLPFMAYEYFPMEKYSISILDAPMHEKVIPGICIRFTRDCPYGCPFCIIGSTTKRGYDRRWKSMSVNRVVDEIEHAVNEWGIWGFFLWDETYTLDKKRAYDISKEIIKRKLRLEWRCLTRIDCVDKELLDIMYRSGCRQIEFGLEAGDPESRKKMHKNFSDQEAVAAVKMARKRGIKVNVDMIVGMPWETSDSMKKTLKLAKKLNADNVHLTMAFPYPGTEFYDIASKEGLILVDDIYDLMINQRVRIGAKPIVKTRHLSSAELEEGWRQIRTYINRYYLCKKIICEPHSFIKIFTSCRNAGEFFVMVKKAVRRLTRAILLKST